MSENTLSRIEESYGAARLAGWQIAADGQWDKAARFIFVRQDTVDPQKFVDWLAQQETKNIAMEALFDLPDGRRFFFGARITDLILEEKRATVLAMLTTTKSGDSLQQVVQQLGAQLNEPLAEKPGDYLEIGVFDLWRRVKSLVVWRRDSDENLLATDRIGALAAQPDAGFAPLDQPQPRPVMMESAWDITGKHTIPCWVSLPVSEEFAPGRHRISANAYYRAAKTLVGITR